MRYYKIIVENNIVGIVTSENFTCYSPIIGCFLRTDDLNGEFVEFRGVDYRDTWMKPLTKNVSVQLASVVSISEEEYNIYLQAFDTQEEIIPQENDDNDEPEYIPDESIDPIKRIDLNFMRENKINEMSYLCNKTIENGFDLIINDQTYHFSLTTQDQLNLISLGAMAQAGTEPIPYHADGEICRFYSAAEMNQIVAAATAFKIYQTTYYNALKNYINSLETIEEISAITYGIELPEEYKSEVLKALENENK